MVETLVRRQVADTLKRTLAERAHGQPANPETLRRVLQDARESMQARRHAAWVLGRQGQVAIIREALRDPSIPAPVRAIAVDGLGFCQTEEARALLRDSLLDAEETVRLAAVRALSISGAPDATAQLASLVCDPDQPLSVRCEAAESLGNVPGVEARDTLLRLFTEMQEDEDVAEALLAGLGTRDLPEVQDFFATLLADASTDLALRVAAVRAFEGSSDPALASFLLPLIRSPDEDLRAAAAWVLATLTDPGDVGGDLFRALASEASETVRLRLYQALGAQPRILPAALLPTVLAEADPVARLAGYETVLGALRQSPDADLQARFSATAIPELGNLALTTTDLARGLTAVRILKQEGSDAARRALRQIAAGAANPAIAAAAARP
jgi:HEAT repeat protein